MNKTLDKTTVPKPIPEPTWEVAYLFPPQGTWSEEEYLALDGNFLVELSDGKLEVLAMPTTSHQAIVAFLLLVLSAFVLPRKLGRALTAPLPMRIRSGKFREPDLLFMMAQNAKRVGEQFWEGADLVMEIVSENRRHDLVTKRKEYAKAGIAEYWIVDPKLEQITVLVLRGDSYRVHGAFGRGAEAVSVLLPGFSIDVNSVLAGEHVTSSGDATPAKPPTAGPMRKTPQRVPKGRGGSHPKGKP
jgi:Uma2 family endonuclease